MSYYELVPAGRNVMAYIQENEFSTRLEKQRGLRFDIEMAHRIFSETPKTDQVVQLHRVDKDVSVTDKKFFEDIIVGLSVPIVSQRVRELVLNLGGSVDAFLPCEFESKECGSHYWYFPNVYDVVDIEKSRFLMMMPVPNKAPVPHNIISMELRSGGEINAHFFLASKPQPNQVFSELIVSDRFKELWEGAKLTGAKFRKLTVGMPP